MLWTRVRTLHPTPANHVSDPVDMTLLEIEGNALKQVPVEQVVKHRTADDVYGRMKSDVRVFNVSFTTAVKCVLPRGTAAVGGVGIGVKCYVSGSCAVA